MPSKVLFYNKKNRAVPIEDIYLKDELSGDMVSIDNSHHKIHDGLSFLASAYDDTLLDTETLNIAFKTPRSPTSIHFYVEFNTLVGGKVELWEAPTWTTDTGTLFPIKCRNRNCLHKSTLLEDKTATPIFSATDNLLENVTGLSTATATLLHHLYAWGSKSIGAGTRADQNEFVLRPETKYVILFTAIGSANKAELVLNWYETDLTSILLGR